jgi:hypothetical protein
VDDNSDRELSHLAGESRSGPATRQEQSVSYTKSAEPLRRDETLLRSAALPRPNARHPWPERDLAILATLQGVEERIRPIRH